MEGCAFEVMHSVHHSEYITHILRWLPTCLPLLWWWWLCVWWRGGRRYDTIVVVILSMEILSVRIDGNETTWSIRRLVFYCLILLALNYSNDYLNVMINVSYFSISDVLLFIHMADGLALCGKQMCGSAWSRSPPFPLLPEASDMRVCDHYLYSMICLMRNSISIFYDGMFLGSILLSSILFS
jgi:hypothetical protein